LVYLRLFCFFLCLFACANRDVQLTEAHFEHDYISVTFSSDVFIEHIQVRNGSRVVYTQEPKLLLRKISIPIAWQQDSTYSLIVNKTQQFVLNAPNLQANVPVNLQFPLGQKSIPLLADSSFHTALAINQQIQAALFFTSKLDTQRIRLQLIAEDMSAIVSDTLIILEPFATKNYVLLSLDRKASLNFRLQLSGDVSHIAQMTIQPTTVAELSAETSLHHVQTPALANGSVRAFDKPNVIYLDDPITAKMRRYFSAQRFSKNLNSPATFVSIDVENQSDQDKRYLAELLIFDEKTGQAHPAFVPNDWERNGFAPISKITFNLPAKQRARFALPVFVDRSLISAGAYQADVCLKLFGSANILHRQNMTLNLVYQQYAILISFILITLFGFCSLGYFFLRISKKVKEVDLQALITIAIFASIHVALNYILTLIDSSFLSILGPFKIFISGFFSETLYYTILVSLFMIFPKKDVISTKLILSFLLSIVVSGGVGLTTFSTLGVHLAVFSGLFLFWSGHASRFWIFLIFISFFDAAYSYYGLLEMRLLYDYHYADWYMLLYAVIVGFLYTAVGCLLGRYLGQQFKKVIAH
jgi:hypothetical protein